jgi:hypothetical protein
VAATISLQQTIQWCQPYLNWANLSIGTAGEPAMSAANLTLQTIVGPPFVWPWNRANTSFITTAGVQDYTMNISNYGFLETASCQLYGAITSVVANGTTAVFQCANNFAGGSIDQFSDAMGAQGGTATVNIVGCTTSGLNGTQTMISANATSFTISTTVNVTENETGAFATAGKIFPLELKWGALTEATEQGRPEFIATQLSNESGVSFTLRLLSVPDTTYIIRLNYQESPTLFTSVNNTWGIPDQLEYIYNYFFMFLMMDYFDDPRAGRYRQLAVAALLSRADGLEETDRNLFLGNWLPLMKQEIGADDDAKQGSQARGL